MSQRARSLKFVHPRTGQHYGATLEDSDKMFVFFLPAGQFEIARVQIGQGPCRSIAQFSSFFSLSEEAFVSIGIWISARIRELTDGWRL